jgi:hypothetical protein
MSDQVLKAGEISLKKIKDRLEFEEKKLAQVKTGMFDGNGNPRLSLIQEAAQRKISIEELQDRVKNLNANLEAAKADLPRRDRERARAAEIEIKIQAKKKETVALIESLRQIEGTVRELELEKSEALQMASATAKDLKLQLQAEEERLEKQKQEALNMASLQLHGAEIDLENGRKDQLPPEHLKEREKRVEIYRRKVEELQAAGV